MEGHWKLENLSAEEESGIPCSGEMRRYGGTPVAKATFWSVTDADVQRGDQTGLDTPGSPRRKR